MYAREVDGKTLEFGVSGLLWNSNVLMYDRATDSLWSQALHQAVTGPMSGKKLKKYPSTLTTWGKWRKAHPDTRALTFNTGYRRDYSEDPYADYYESRGGRMTWTRKAFMAERFMKCRPECVMAAIELYTDKHYGQKDERYCPGIAIRLTRGSAAELEKEMDRHRHFQRGRGLYAGTQGRRSGGNG